MVYEYSYKRSSTCKKTWHIEDTHTQGKGWWEGENLPSGHVKETVRMGELNPSIWTFTIIWKAKGSSEGERSITERVTRIGENKG